MNENLLPCPFCGGAGEWEYAPRNEETGLGDDGTGLIECQGCKVRVHGCYREEAEAKWNTRTHDATLHAPRWWHCDTHGQGSHTAWGCPECVREMRDEIKRMRAAMLPTPDTLALNPQYGYGCHCDLEPGQKPDKCVIEDGRPFDCTNAQRLLSEGKGRNDCDEWKPIVRMRY